ncbi:MAG: spondin domain-containing protein [Granulosicoccus sp.]
MTSLRFLTISHFIVLLAVTVLSACGSSNTPEPIDETQNETTMEAEQPAPDNQPDTSEPTNNASEATYTATFSASWSAETHPVNFPANPHFSPLVGAIHSEQSVLWEMGQMASPGIEQMAETGGTSLLIEEIQAVIDEGRALTSIRGSGVPLSPGSINLEFTVSQEYPLVTLVSMLAPSPDWFIGVDRLSTLDNQGGFLPAISVTLKLYDSGTDSGTRYDAANVDTQPPSAIDTVTTDPADTGFVNGEPIVGTLLFTRTQ